MQNLDLTEKKSILHYHIPPLPHKCLFSLLHLCSEGHGAPNPYAALIWLSHQQCLVDSDAEILSYLFWSKRRLEPSAAFGCVF